MNFIIVEISDYLDKSSLSSNVTKLYDIISDYLDKSSLSSNVTKLYDIICNLLDLKELLITIILFILFVCCAASFNRKMRSQSNKQLNYFKENKKYIKQLFIELNDNKELLNYYAYNSKRKRKIVNDYNSIFSYKYARKLKKFLKNEIVFKIYPFYSYSKISNIISHNILIFNKYKNGDFDYENSKMGDFIFIIEFSSCRYINKLTKLKKYCDIAQQNSVVITNSAGNGKTNLLCNFVEMLCINKNPCLFLNSKDIKSNCIEVFNKHIIHKKLKDFSNMFLILINIVLFFRRKYFFIVLDAINENDNEYFISSLGAFNDFVSKYTRIKILYSCRTEYFDIRYEKLFENCENPPYKACLKNTKYDNRAKENLLKEYKSYYKFDVKLSNESKNKLFKSLILMRMFFEVNENKKPKKIGELHNASIYNEYIKIVNKKTKPLNLYCVLSKISQIMTDSFDFSEIKISDLNLSSEDLNLLKKAMDNNVLISRTIYKAKGSITENIFETVYFVFDELRDFVVARYWLLQCEEKENYISFWGNLDRLYNEKMSPLEGVTKYAYYYFKKFNIKFCKKILNSYGVKDVVEIKKNIHRYDDEYDQEFNNFGINIILGEGNVPDDFEIDYIAQTVKSNKSDLIFLLIYLIKNDQDELLPNLDIFIKIIIKIYDLQYIEDVLNELFCLNNYRNYLDSFFYQFGKYLEQYKKNKGKFSKGLQELILVIYSLCPQVTFLRQYLIDQDVINDFINNLEWIELKTLLEETQIKFQKEPEQEDILNLILEISGDDDE